MNRLLLASAVALASAATASAAIGVETYPVPSPITQVAPAQGLINLNADVNPLGVSEISFYMPSPSINKECTAKAKVYIDGNDEPFEEVGVESAYVDAMGYPIASFKFKSLLLDPGLYRVVVPEGFFFSGSTPTPEVQLGYEIYIAYTVDPIPGNVESASKFTMEFPDYQEVSYSGGIEFYPDASTLTYQVNVEIPQQEGVNPNKMIITIVDENNQPVTVTNPANYTLFVPEGSIKYTAYGPSYYEDPTDKVTESTPELRLRYVIPAMPKPEINPAEGEVENFRSFVVTFPEDFSIQVVDDKMSSYIYAVLPNGTISRNPLYQVKANSIYDAAKRQVTFNIITAAGNPIRTPVNPGPGRYAFSLNPCVYGQIGTEFVANAPFDYFYTIPAPVFEIKADPESGSTVSKLEDVVLYFPWADNMDINSANTEKATIASSNGNVDGVNVSIAIDGGIAPLADGTVTEYTPKAVLSVFPTVTALGDYVITIPAGYFKSGAELSPACTLTYTIAASGVEGVEVATDVTVFTIDGVKVLDKAAPEAIYTLPAGLYIVNGKKVVLTK